MREPKGGDHCPHGHRTVNCQTCTARSTSEWCVLSDEDVAFLNELKVCNVYQPGQTIFYQGNPCLGIYCVESGAVALRKTDANGNSVLVRLVHSGETLGYRAYFSGGAYSASAEALTPCRICFVDRGGVRMLIDRNPAVAYRFLHRLATDLEQAEQARLHAVAMPLRGRLAHLLLLLKERYGTVDDDGNIVVDLPMSRQDVAAMLGTRPETVTRLIRALERDRVVEFEGRTARIPDLDALLDEVEAYTDL